MKNSLIVVLVFLLAQNAIAQKKKFGAHDSTRVKLENTHRLGFFFGISYSNLALQSSPFFLTDSTFGSSTVLNGLGGSAGICWIRPIGKHFLLRTGLEANMMSAAIEYDTKNTLKDWSGIYSLAVETPIVLIYSHNIDGNLFAVKKGWPELHLGLRPVFQVTTYSSIYPVTKPFNLNADVGIGYPIRAGKVQLRVEAFYSFGMLNIIGIDTKDVRTSSVDYLGRSFGGLRFYFN